MPYLVSTIQKATATQKAVSGFFVGTAGDFGWMTVVAYVNRISLCSCTDSVGSGTKHRDPNGAHVLHESDTLSVVQEFSLQASIVLMEAVPIVNPVSGSIERHVLFFVTSKHQYSIVAFAPTSAVGSQSAGQVPALRMVRVYWGYIEASFYQPHYDGSRLSAVTTVDTLLGGASAVRGGSSGAVVKNVPIVAISIFHRNIMLFDVACCIAQSCALRERLSAGDDTGASLKICKRQLRSLFSEDFWTHAAAPRREYAPLTVQYLDETTVFSIAFGVPQNASSQLLPIFVLHSDHRTRTHVAEYELNTDCCAPTPNSGVPSAIQLAILGLGFDDAPTKSPMKWKPMGQAQTDLEMEARQLVVTRLGTCVVGAQLVTCIRTTPSGKKHVITEAIPQPLKNPSEVRACSLCEGGTKFFAAFTNGVILSVQVKLLDDEVSVLSADDAAPKLEVHVVTSGVPNCGLPECILAMSPVSFFVGSVLGNSVTYHTGRRHSAVVIENAGPILDLAVISDGARSGVMASCGADVNGALYLMRAAVNVEEAMRMPYLDSLSNIFVAGNFVCLAFPTQTRFVSFARNDDEESASEVPTVVEELDPSRFAFVLSDETVYFGLGGDGGALEYVQVTAGGDVVVIASDGAVLQRHKLTVRAQHVAGMPQLWLLAVTSGREVLVVDWKSNTVVHTATHENELSCVDATCDGWVLVAEWLSCAITARHVSRLDAPAIVMTQCSVPRSIATMPLRNGHSARTVCVGNSDGTIAMYALPDVDTVPSARTLAEVRTATLSRQPVQLRGVLYGPQRQPGVVCCCDVPALIYEREGKVCVTGIAADVEIAASTKLLDTSSLVPPFVFGSPSDQAIRFGSLQSAQRVTKTPVPFLAKKTISVSAYLEHFRCIITAARGRSRDEITVLPTSTCFTFGSFPSAAATGTCSSNAPGHFSLLENERCNFAVSLVIGGSNEPHSDSEAARAQYQTPSKAQWQSEAWRAEHGSAPFNAIVIGTSFMFPEESMPRSSRLLFGVVEHVSDSVNSTGKTNRLTASFCSLGEKDLTGALTCCAPVPNCPNRIALGINGSVVLMKWHAIDRDFTMEASIAVGQLLIGLRPLYPRDDVKTIGLLVVSDWKHSVAMVRVNSIDGGLELAAREGSLRGVVCTQLVKSTGDAAANVVRVENPPTLQGYEIVYADERMNLYAVSQGVAVALGPSSSTASREEDDDVEGPAAPRVTSTTWTANKRLSTCAQFHVGDRITSIVCGELSPCADASASVRGSLGNRMLYGTVHGAIGCVIPVAPLPYRLYELLELHTIAALDQQDIGGLFDYSEFREILPQDHMHGVCRNPSFFQRRNKRSRSNEGATIAVKFDDDKYRAKGVTDGDVIERYLDLPIALQSTICDAVNAQLLTDIVKGEHGFPEKQKPQKKKPTVVDELLEGKTAGDAEVAEVAMQPSESELDEANDLLRKWMLPQLPLTVGAVVELVTDLQRSHE